MTDQAQTLINTPVIFMQHSVFDAAMNAADWVGALRAQSDIADVPLLTGQDEGPLRLRIHFVSSVPVDVERVGDIGTNHGYLSGQPVVPYSDGSGIAPTPAADATKDESKTGGDAYDWLDAPPDGYVAYGLWVFDQHSGLGSIMFRGVTCAVPLVLRGTGVALTVSAVVNALNKNPSVGVYFGPADSPPSVDDAQSTTDAAAGRTSHQQSYTVDSRSPIYTAVITALAWVWKDDQDTAQSYTDVLVWLTVAPPAATAGGN